MKFLFLKSEDEISENEENNKDNNRFSEDAINDNKNDSNIKNKKEITVQLIQMYKMKIINKII